MGLWSPTEHRTLNYVFRFNHADVSIHVGRGTSGGIPFLGGVKLVSWASKSRTASMSSSDASIVSFICVCAKVLTFRMSTSKHGESNISVLEALYVWSWKVKGAHGIYLSSLDDGVAASFQRSRIHKPHAHTQAFKVNHSTSR
ncbi:hypothetical protein Tco_1310378 [Tanacetum coccineum]